MIAIDTNLLVYAHRRGVAEHRVAQRTIQKASEDGRGWGISIQSVAEFWAVVTHPASVGGPSSPDSARAFLSTLRDDAGMRVWSPGIGFESRLLQLATDLGVTGSRIFDLQIALTAFAEGALELWTHDLAFIKVPGLLLRYPLSERKRSR